jgi:DNA processing protein
MSPPDDTDFDPDTLDHLRLALVPGLGPKLTRAALDHFGSAAAVLRATAGALRDIPLVGDKTAEKIAAGLRDVEGIFDRELTLLRDHRVRIAVRGTPDYPTRLTTIDDAPGLLYYRGVPADDAEAVGIVGSRSCTSYGKRMAATIAAGLARAGFTVVSGLALGIDGAAHEGALDAGGRTVAVLGGGLAKVYPPQHLGLADRVAATGMVITETPMVLPTKPEMFPARNRIISALSRAVVVIEANDRSGALITARLAGEQGREVFVVPGNADSGHSAGCHELIRKGARLVRHADDILEDLRGIAPPDPVPPKRERRTTPELPFTAPPPPAPTGPPPGLDDAQLRLWDALATPRHADELARELGLDAGAISTLVFKLELKKAARKLPGGMIERR